MRNLLQSFKSNLLNIPGWKTNRKIIVIESDDWGTIRTSSKKSLKKIQENFDIELNPYILNDSLESEDDLIALFETIASIKNNIGQSPIITANSLVANPDFEKIQQSNFKHYHYEHVTETFKNTNGSFNCIDLWKNGIHENIFKPQFHGREHLNVSLWMKLLQFDNLTKMMFEDKFWGIVKRGERDFVKKNSMAGCNYSSENELEFLKKSILEGLDIFESILGYKSKSFIANNYIWDEKIEEILKIKDVLYIQGQSFELYPAYKREIIKKNGKRNFLGTKNKFGQIYLTRNCSFEPFMDSSFNESISSCLKEVDYSFRWNRPAIISTHRVNYIGRLNENNRKVGLQKLKVLLESIIKKYPNVEFLSSDKLGDFIFKIGDNL
jgi:hypothetical protein